MKTDYLYYVLEIARTGSINMAAKKLWMSPTSLSSMLRSVEAELGVTIFDRSNKGLSTTEEGHLLIKQIERILDEYNKLLSMAATPRLDGVICNLGCYSSLVPSLGAYLANNFQGDYALHIHSTQLEMLLQSLQRGTIDVGLSTVLEPNLGNLEALAAESDLVLESMYRDQYVLCVGMQNPLARQDRVTLDEAMGCKFCCTPALGPLFQGHPDIDLSRFRLQSIFDECESIKHIVASTDAIAIMPDITMRTDYLVTSGAIKVLPFTDIDLSCENVMIYPRRNRYSATQQNVRRSIRDFFESIQRLPSPDGETRGQ